MSSSCRCTVVLVSTLLAISSGAYADTKEEITKLIPAASAMQRADFEKMATGSAAPNADGFEDKSLSLMMLTIKAVKGRAKQQIEEFKYLGETAPKPSKIVAEMYRTIGTGRFRLLRAPVTIIHANRIKGVTVEAAGDMATGVVSFEVPELYSGKVHYVAKKSDDKWQIAEFKLPANRIHIVRGDDGTWTSQANE